MTTSGKLGLTLALALASLTGWLVLAEKPPAPPAEELSPDEQREKVVIDRFVGLLEKNPRRGTALDRIYGYHVERGSLDKLIDQYRQRAKKDGKDGTAWMIVGLLEAQRGKDANAVAAFREAEPLLPTNALAAYYLGQALMLVGQPDAAAEAFRRALDRKPIRTDLLDIFQALGRVYQRAQRPEKALAVWKELEDKFPDDLRVLEQIASTLAEEGQFDQALPRYEKLAKSARDEYRKVTYRMEAAELKVRLKQTAKALADFEDLLGQLNPDNWLYREVRRKIEEVFLRNDDQAGLAKYYDEWLKKNPDDVEAMSRLARTLSTQGRLPEARTWLEKAIEKAPTRRELRQALIEQLVFEQKWAEAAAQYEAMDKAQPNNPDTLREWGKLLLRDTARPETERKQAAVAVWKRLLERRPKDAVIAAQVADLVRTAGLEDEAVALYRKAIELAPNAPQYREYLGEYYHSLKRTKDAMDTWRPIAEGANRNAKNLARLAEVQAGFGYRKEALATLAVALTLEKDDFNLILKYADLLHQEEHYPDALAQLATASKLIGSPEDAESVLQAQIRALQASETLTAETDKLQKELDAKTDATAERWHRLARYYEAARQLPEAVEAIDKALALDGKSVPALASAARIHESGGNLLAAAETNRRLAAVDRRFRTEYLTNVAKLEARLGRRAQALQAGRDLLAAAPGNPEHHKFFAELCFQLGEGDEGLESLRRAVRANPSDPQGLLTLGAALAERFRTGEAIELYWRAFDKTPELEGKLSVIGRLTELYIQNNQFDRLVERLERERRESDKQREMTICLAQAYQAAGDHGTARQRLEGLLVENARDTQLLAQLSALAESDNDLPVALKYQRQLEKAAPNNREHQLRLAQLLVRAGESDEAATIWTKLVANEPEPHRTLQAIDSLLTNGKPEAVVAITGKLLAAKPGDWELLYREGVALAALEKRDEAARRFQAILAMHLPDDEPGAAEKANQKKPKSGRPVGTAAGGTKATPAVNLTLEEPVPLQRRSQNIYEVRAAIGLDPRYGYSMSTQQRSWGPADYGQARMAAIGWLMSTAQRQNKQDAFVKERRLAHEKAKADPRVQWDWYYLQTLRQDRREVYEVSKVLAQAGDATGLYAFLAALPGRTDVAGRPIRRNRPGMVDTTPPLSPAELERVLDAYRKLRKQKPQWVNSTVLTSVLTELKRAKRTDDDKAVLREAVEAGKQQPAALQAVLGVVSERGDVDATLELFAKMEENQRGAGKVIGRSPLDQASWAFVQAMKARALAKAPADCVRLFERYQAAERRLRPPGSGRSVKATPGGSMNVSVIQIPSGYGHDVMLEYPAQPNDYFDRGSIQLLRNLFEVYKRQDLMSDLFAHYRGRLEKAEPADRVYLRLILSYLHWWAGEKAPALKELAAACDAVPNDVNLRLDLAALHERGKDFAAALAVLDSINPLEATTMQRRETDALRLAVQTGNVERARAAADRLFGLRMDAETQVKLAGQMHQLGMHDAAETVLGRAQRQAGNRTETLISLMNQYSSQNKPDLAVQIARQLLRKGPSTQFQPYYYRQSDPGRNEAIQTLARSGKLSEMIERAEAQVKSSPKSQQLYQTLIDYYRAAGDKEKLKVTARKMAEVRPDDGKLRFQVGREFQQLGDFAAAVEHFKVAIKKEPTAFAYRYWEIQQAFMQANKYDDLIKLIEEADLRAMGGNYWAVLELLQPLFQNEKTRDQGMKLFRKTWKAFPDQRAYMMGNLYYEEIWRLPEIYAYAKEAVVPGVDEPLDPWRGCDQIINYGNDGLATGLITRLLEAARRQNKLVPLRKDVEEALKRHPEWHAGKALRAIVELQCGGRPEDAAEVWKKLLRETGRIDAPHPMPLAARWVLGQELENYEALEDLVRLTYEGGVEESLGDPNYEFGYSPITRLIKFHKDHGRNAEARALVLRFADGGADYPYDPGYNAYRKINTLSGVASQLQQLGYPVDAVRVYSRLLNEGELFDIAARYWGGENRRQQMEDSIRQTVKKLKAEALRDALGELLQPATKPGEPGEALDLILLPPGHDLERSTLTSMLETALAAGSADPKAAAEVGPRLEKLAAERPKDLSVQIATVLFAAAGPKQEPMAEAVKRLMKLVETMPLEKLPAGISANARQRAEAAKQIGLWLVARACLKKESLRTQGAFLGRRAADAARRQLDTTVALTILRDWGRLELDNGDRKAAEARWAEMLELVLPPPAAAKADADIPAVPAPVPAPAPPVPAPPAFAAPVPPPAVLPPAVAPKPAAPLVPAVTLPQFQQVAQVADLATEQKMYALSMRALRDVLRAGPPVPAASNSNMSGMVRYWGPTGEEMGNNVRVEPMLQSLTHKWRRHGVPSADIYETLAAVVMPEGRPSEVFLYAQDGGDFRAAASAGRLLAEEAARAGWLDDLRKRASARQAQPLAELTARLLLFEAALVARDTARATELLKDLDARLKKDTLQTTAERIGQTVGPALERPDLAAAALPILELAAKNLANTPSEHSAVMLRLLLARYHFDHAKPDEGKKKLKEIMGTAMRGMLSPNGDANRIAQQVQPVVREYIRAGLLTDALELFGMAADLPPSMRAHIPEDALASVTAPFARRVAALPAAERYAMLKKWTLPTSGRKSVRVLATFLPMQAPPREFGPPVPVGTGRGSTFALLIDAAREAGKLDELAGEVEKLAGEKVENAKPLFWLVQIARGQGAAVEAAVRERLVELKKKAEADAESPPIQSRYYYNPYGNNQPPPVEWNDFLLACACLEAKDAKLGELGEEFATHLITKAGGTPFGRHLHYEQSRRQAARVPQAGPDGGRDPGLKRWHSTGTETGPAAGALPVWWVMHAGHLAYLGGPGEQAMYFDLPLTGKFEVEAEAVHGAMLAYGGRLYGPLGGQVAPVGRSDQLYRPVTAMRPDFNRLTLQVEPGKVRCLVNGHLFFEDAGPAPVAPWVGLIAGPEAGAVFRNVTLRGTPEVPREVRLTTGDRLEGWDGRFYTEALPPRLSKLDQQPGAYDPEGGQREKIGYDWSARDGEIHGKRLDGPSGKGVGSLLAYHRPLRAGETLRYEFFYKPDEVMVHPALGRLGFLLDPKGVRLHWLTDVTGEDWTGLEANNAVEVAADRRGPKELPLKADAWNALELALTEQGLTLKLNGTAVYERKWQPGDGRTFGLFRFKDHTAAQVRNVVLTGDWPALKADDLAGLMAVANPPFDGPARRALVGEEAFARGAADVLKEARALPAAERYARLLAWVLPADDRPNFQTTGEFAPELPESAPAGKASPRTYAGGRLEAPALELIAAAREAGKLDELAERVAKVPPGEGVAARGRLAVLALVESARGKDAEAAAALKQLPPLLAKLPAEAPAWQRWPEVLAVAGTLDRPALREDGAALLKELAQRYDPALTAKVKQPVDEEWALQIRHLQARAAAAGEKRPAGAGPRLAVWSPVASINAGTRGSARPPAQWLVDGKEIRHEPGHAHDYLVCRVPLRGDFEVAGEMRFADGRSVHLAYGGLQLELKADGKSYDLTSFGRKLRTVPLAPPLPPAEWTAFKLVVKDGTWTLSVQGRTLCEEWLLPHADPWLLLHAEAAASAGVRNLRVAGKPTVPEQLPLGRLPDLTGWQSYYSEPMANPEFGGQGAAWEKRGEEIVGRSQRSYDGPDGPGMPTPQHRTYTERALHYHRPMLEDGTVGYEFYYEPEKVLAHPAVDRLAFLLEPDGVRLHWLTNGHTDRSGLGPDNVRTEAADRRGPAKLPLKAKAWNRIELSLVGDTVTLKLNGTEVYQRKLEATNQRTFGLFHYADLTDARVRNVVYTGKWPTALPEGEQLFGPAGKGADE